MEHIYIYGYVNVKQALADLEGVPPFQGRITYGDGGGGGGVVAF